MESLNEKKEGDWVISPQDRGFESNSPHFICKPELVTKD